MHNTRDRAGGAAAAVYVLFAVSGFTALAYEVIWTRLLIRVFGASSLAVATVLASYMAGLALGSFAFGRLIDRRGTPLRLYGYLELGIGMFAVAFLYIVPALSGLYGGLYPAFQERFYTLSAVRVVLSFGVLLIPTTLMGGTLPVLSKYLATGLEGLAERVGRLYAVNTLGAVGGAAIAGIVILPSLGIRNTTVFCALLNLGVVAVALGLGRGRRAAPVGRGREPDGIQGVDRVPKRISRHVLVTFTVTGFCALAAEVVWTRMLSLALGTTVYAFAIMLSTFLLGLGLGSAVFARLARRTGRPGRVLGFAVAGIGFGVFLSLAIFGRIPFVYMELFQRQQLGWGVLLWIQLLLSGMTVIIPAFLMGGIFPLVARMYARDISKVGREIGQVYAFNTVGAILGSVAGSFLFLRMFGVERSLLILGSVYIAAGLAVLVNMAEFRRRVYRVCFTGLVAAIAAVVLLVSPILDRKLLTSGVYVYAPTYKTAEGLRDHMRRIFILFYDEGVDATVSVEGFRGELSLLIDGKADASTGNQDMRTQVLLAQVPMLLHPDPDTVLVIGLGSGISLGSIETHEVEWIDCVELLDNVVEASGLFSEYNFDCLGDPRVHMIIGDGRNHVLLTDRKYDAIISHPTNPWISGVGDLFTQEFFQLARRRLRPGGLMCSWFHTYHMGEQDVRALVGTFVSVFPHASMWLQDDGNIILVGSVEPMVIDAYLASRMAVPEVVADLRRVRTESPLDLVANYVAGSQSLGRYAEPAGNFNTDDNMLLEFSAGRRGFESTVPEQIANFIDLIEFPPLGPQSGFDSVGIAVRMEARKLALEGTVIMSREGVTAAMPLFERAYALSPSEAYVEQKYIEGRLILAQACLERGDYTNARENYLAALVASDHPYAWRVYLGLGMSLAGSGDTKGALESFAASIRLNPDNPVAYHNLGILKRVTGNMGEAVTALEQALRLEPDPDVASDLSRIYMEMGVRLGEAARLAEQAVTWRASAEHYITLGWAQNRLGHDREAEQAMLEALKLEADNTEAMYALATMKLARNDLNGAVEMLQETVRLGRRDRYSDLAARKLRELKVQ